MGNGVAAPAVARAGGANTAAARQAKPQIIADDIDPLPAGSAADPFVKESAADSKARPRAPHSLLRRIIGFIVVILVLDIIIPGVVPKWAIFAPVFLPIFNGLGMPPQTVLAAYRIGDGPMNTMTPLMVYLPFIVTVAQRYKKDAGMGTIVALMLPYVVVIAVASTIMFVIWYVLGIPLGPGSPVDN